jgi:hypothetical protein
MADSAVRYQDIDEEFPIAGQDNDSQGFRDNFSEIKQGLQVANTELTDLLTNSARLDEDNNFNGNDISNAALIQIADKVYNTGNLSINTTIEWSDGSYQNITVNSDIVLSLGSWPTSGSMGIIRMAIRSDGVSRTVTLDAANAGTVFRNSTWPISGTITVSSLTTPIFVDAWSSDGGATVFMEYKGPFTTT